MFKKKKRNRNICNPNEIKDSKHLINELIKLYVHGQKSAKLSTLFPISPKFIIDTYSNVALFPFQPGVNCSIQSNNSFASSSKMSLIDLELSYSQGNRVFISIINPGFIEDLTERELMVRDRILSIASSIISSKMTNKEKAKIVHDYLIDTSEYDSDLVRYKHTTEDSYTPYGLLFNHKAVCQAYAETYMLLMTVIGIECFIVTGKLLTSSGNASDNHAWNIIKINNKYGHVDVTSDNPYPKRLGYKANDFFYANDDFMDKTHVWRIDKYPLCPNPNEL